MEGVPSPKSAERSEGVFSCWGLLKLKVSWRRRFTRRYRQIKSNLMRRKSSSVAGCRYDPLSYAQNFDDGCDHEEDYDQDLSGRGFSARFAAPLTNPLQLEV